MRVKVCNSRYYIVCDVLGMHFRIGPYEDPDPEYLKNRVEEILDYMQG